MISDWSVEQQRLLLRYHARREELGIGLYIDQVNHREAQLKDNVRLE